MARHGDGGQSQEWNEKGSKGGGEGVGEVNRDAEMRRCGDAECGDGA
jgi:hypothetical protein